MATIRKGVPGHYLLMATMSQCRAKGYLTADELMSIMPRFTNMKQIRACSDRLVENGLLRVVSKDTWAITPEGVDALSRAAQRKIR